MVIKTIIHIIIIANILFWIFGLACRKYVENYKDRDEKEAYTKNKKRFYDFIKKYKHSLIKVNGHIYYFPKNYDLYIMANSDFRSIFSWNMDSATIYFLDEALCPNCIFEYFKIKKAFFGVKKLSKKRYENLIQNKNIFEFKYMKFLSGVIL